MRRKDSVEQTPVGGKRWGRRATWAGLATAGILILALTLFTLANRPRWRTIMLANRAGTAAIAFDCPDDWLVESGQDDVISPNDAPYLSLRHKSPAGLLRWWNVRVLHVREHPFNLPEVHVQVMTSEHLKMRPDLSLEAQASKTTWPPVQSNYRRSTERVSHPLGPAVKVTVNMQMPASFNGPMKTWTWLPKRMNILYIYPAKKPGQDVGLVSILCAAPAEQYPQFKPVFDRMMESVRIVNR